MGRRRHNKRVASVTQESTTKDSIKRNTERWLEIVAWEGLMLASAFTKRPVTQERLDRTIEEVKKMSRKNEVLKIEPNPGGEFDEKGNWHFKQLHSDKWIFIYSKLSCGTSIPMIEAERNQRLIDRVKYSNSQLNTQYNA